jgi:ppGpp synthetase/RelA/SpoT-type nucleotidyltranferase
MSEIANEDGRASEVKGWYTSHIFKCQLFEQKMVGLLSRQLAAAQLQDLHLEHRTKTIESFVAKASKRTPDGRFKYEDPLAEITDAVGARIIVPLSTDVSPVVSMLKQNYVVDEEAERLDEETGVDVPGYRSIHLLLRLNEGERADPDLAPFGDMVLEVQVRTILQHAWASLQHDLMYKTERAPTSHIRRRLIALAGVLELADREFLSIRQGHAEGLEMAETTASATDGIKGSLSAGLRLLAESLFAGEEPGSPDWYARLQVIVERLGMTSIDEVREALEPVLDHASAVVSEVRATTPWANAAYLLDLLLRLALRERYLDVNLPTSEQDRLSPVEVDDLRRAFLGELDEIVAAVGTA